MIITYYGQEFIKLQVGDNVIGINAPSKESKHKKTSFGADIALTTLNHSDFNGGPSLSRGDRNPFVIEGPGEYEIGGTFIKGFASESKYDGKERINTIYSLSVDGMNICFLGALSNPALKNETIEAIDGVDILFVPIGGDGVLTPAEGYKIAVQLEPKLIIPIHFEEGGKEIKTFLKEGGSEKIDPQEKLTLKKKDLDGKEGEIALLVPSNS